MRVCKRIGCLCARRRTLEVTHVSIITQSSAKPTRTNTRTATAARVLRVRECNEMMQQKHFRTVQRRASYFDGRRARVWRNRRSISKPQPSKFFTQRRSRFFEKSRREK